ncbi:hypothetical protein BDB00DRAFT_758817 [Zychaea mexicana]|uniref:uncharacterized protein n=1 Tax=Zychaea mexicana TaxID=64656 RepID=UPI0022FF002B|nr:uncharacterized protein BDB00DRAFT_758817 [Zychaea mexicana]KAI9496286.1 hypothetical protein BDB00DRAFT_758817 [Zychaea mexicana]
MLMRHINDIKVSLSPFNTASKASRLFLNRVNTNEARKLNPALKITTTILSDAQAPSRIDVVYRDGKKLGLDTDKLKIDNIVELVNKHAKKLEEVEQANSW